MNEPGGTPFGRSLCRGELLIIGFLGITLLSATIGIVVLSIDQRDIPPSLASIASASLTALVSILISPRR